MITNLERKLDLQNRRNLLEITKICLRLGKIKEAKEFGEHAKEIKERLNYQEK